ncbi:MAG: GntR family transcriptional regulator [Treponema sp.]|jgi:DNA-binding GntR family transcriptional regulator|nr:GntR family transcriptional regulator [Treponema sp.]
MKKAARFQSGSVQDIVYTALRKSILNLNLAPGTAISEKEISRRYEVSRTPVREAFIYLSKEGLVKVIPQKETLVSLIDFSRVEQELFLREHLEMAVLEPFIRNCSPQCVADLEALIEMQAVSFERNEYSNFVNFDNSFHQTFFEVAEQQLSWDVVESMSGHYHRVRLLTIWFQGIAQHIISQHKQLLMALQIKDLDGAKTVLKAHLHKLDTEEKMLREEFPDYFVSLSNTAKDIFTVDFGGLPLFS